MKKLIFIFVPFILLLLPFQGTRAGIVSDELPALKGSRFLTFNAVIRVNQIEVARDRNVGEDERALHTAERVKKYRQAIEEGFPGARITWAFSWLALNDTSKAYRSIREIVVAYHRKYGDDITFLPGAFFANAYNSKEQVNKDLHDGLALVSSLVGGGFRPKSVVAGFLSASNQQYLAEKEGIHVCQGNIWSQYAIDNQDGDGSVSYPYYPSTEHFCKPGQSEGDLVDCVNLDGWSVDFLAGRREGFKQGFNSRLGVGPIETLGNLGAETGLREMLHTTAIHFDEGFKQNSFAWVPNCWEVSLPIDVSGLTAWLTAVRKRWPDVKFVTQGEFGLAWRAAHKSNDFDYHFYEKGSGIGGSDADKEIRWFMNKNFRLALLKKSGSADQWTVIDFTRYDLPAKEPAGMTRRWSLMGEINQKQTRPQDRPLPFSELPDECKKIIFRQYPSLEAESKDVLPVRGFCIGAPARKDVDRFVKFIGEELAVRGVNKLILRVDYNYNFKSHPELASENGLSEDDVRKITEVCHRSDIDVIPQINLLGHQSWAGKTGKLLSVYPEFDETPWVTMPEKYAWPNADGLYCKSYCPLHPGVHKVVFDVVDEICDAFGATAFHAGMDEVFYLGEDRCPLCSGKDKSVLFADEVSLIRDHLAAKGRKLWIWGDRLIDGRTTGMGEWEASYNDTWRAVDMIPRDVVICDWHYERPDQTAVYFAMKGLSVATCPWRDPFPAVKQVQDMLRFRANSSLEMRNRFLGMVQTIWSDAGSFMDEFYSKKPSPNGLSQAECFRSMFAELNK